MSSWAAEDGVDCRSCAQICASMSCSSKSKSKVRAAAMKASSAKQDQPQESYFVRVFRSAQLQARRASRVPCDASKEACNAHLSVQANYEVERFMFAQMATAH